MSYDVVVISTRYHMIRYHIVKHSTLSMVSKVIFTSDIITPFDHCRDRCVCSISSASVSGYLCLPAKLPCCLTAKFPHTWQALIASALVLARPLHSVMSCNKRYIHVMKNVNRCKVTCINTCDELCNMWCNDKSKYFILCNLLFNAI